VNVSANSVYLSDYFTVICRTDSMANKSEE